LAYRLTLFLAVRGRKLQHAAGAEGDNGRYLLYITVMQVRGRTEKERVAGSGTVCVGEKNNNTAT